MQDVRREITAQRLVNQRVDAGAARSADVAEVVRWLGGVQAQEYPVARWSIGQRAQGVAEADVDQALAAGTIVRTHVLRDTWHFVAAEDIWWLLALTGPRIQARNATMYRKLGLDSAQLARTKALLVQALEGGRQRTRKDLAAELEKQGVAATGLRLGYIFMDAEVGGIIGSGGLSGKQHTYALLEERATRTAPKSREDALAELTRRYFTSHGPATIKDFSWWSSLTLADIRRGLEMTSSELTSMDVGGRTYWHASAPASSSLSSSALPVAHLMQGYDEYVIAYTESRDLLDIEGLGGMVPDGQTMYTHAVVLGGQVVGHWRRKVGARAMTVELQLARRLRGAEATALEEAITRYAAFVGLPATWSADYAQD